MPLNQPEEILGTTWSYWVCTRPTRCVQEEPLSDQLQNSVISAHNFRPIRLAGRLLMLWSSLIQLQNKYVWDW